VVEAGLRAGCRLPGSVGAAYAKWVVEIGVPAEAVGEAGLVVCVLVAVWKTGEGVLSEEEALTMCRFTAVSALGRIAYHPLGMDLSAGPVAYRPYLASKC